MATTREHFRPAASYDADGYTWALEQAENLRARRFDLLDVENVAEEIESLGKSLANELRSRYGTLLAHLLKWEFQPEQRSYSWVGTIRRERVEIAKHLRDNPGLKPRRAELFADSYEGARLLAVAETNLPPAHFPDSCPYSLDAADDETSWPGGEEVALRPGRRRR